MPERIPPQNLEAERSVLGALLIDEDAVVQVVEELRPEHFYSPAHGRIYQAVLTLFERREPVDMVTVTDELRKMGGIEEVGGAGFLAELSSSVPTSAHAAYHGKIIRDCALKRQLISAAAEISELACEEKPEASGLLDRAEQKLFSISRKTLRRDFTPIRRTLEVAFSQLDELHKNPESIRGISTGLSSLDGMLAGLQESNLVILAARPAIGKTSLATNIAQFAAVEKGIPVGIFSLETSKEQLVYRMLSAQADVDGWRLTTGRLEEDDFKRIGEAMGELAEAPIFIDDTPGANVVEMRTKSRRLQLEHGVRLIIVDYLQLAKGRGLENRVQEVSEISQALKNLARELNIPVLALSQLSRAVESRTSPRPQLSDLRESGCLAGDTLVQLADGRREPIYKLVEEDKPIKVLALNEETWQLEPISARKAWCTGKKSVFRLETRLGRTVQATANHKFRTPEGWKRLDELKVGEHITLPRSLDVFPQTKATMTESEVALLGHLLGDGCTLPRHAVQYTTNERELADLVAGLAKDFFDDGVRPRIKRERGWWQVYLAASKHLTHNTRNPVAEWLDDLGAWGRRGHEKQVPEKIFQQPSDLICRFLRHLWATDGTLGIFGKKRQRALAYFATSSEKLARDIQHLLLRLGIVARVRRVPQGDKGRDQWHVVITGKPDIVTFVEKIGVVGPKLEKLKALKEFYRDRGHNTNRDIIPKAAWRSLVEPARKALGMSQRAMQVALETEYCGTTLYKANMSRERALRVAQVVKCSTLKKLAQSDVYWDRVGSIKSLGIKEVYDLEVPGHHNFVAGDTIVHNSIEQDSDVVMFLYREDEENRSDVKLLVAKHRNGPTGEISLYFRGERTKFYEAEERGE